MKYCRCRTPATPASTTAARTTSPKITPKNLGQQVSGKIDHHFNDSVALTGVYLYQYTEEPAISYFPDAPFAQGGQNNRPVHVGGHQQHLRRQLVDGADAPYGRNIFTDITPLLYPFDAHTLGFNRAFADAIPRPALPGG